MYLLDMPPSGQAVPEFLRLSAHPLRWRLLTELAGGDRRVRELTGLVGQPQNLVSYHLRLLRGGGLVTARRSSFDGRDTYYHLDLDRCAHELAKAGAVLRLGPSSAAVLPATRPRVLFACTGNSARSPIAEALLRRRAAGGVEVTSAGSHPKPRVHAGAVRVLGEEFGIDIAGSRPRHLDTVAGGRFHYVITLCDKVREVCPEFGAARSVHWSIPDPAGAGEDGPAFVRVAEEIDSRIRHLLPVLAAKENDP
jgi:ArsR family transcriptional regulator, arsenate/arsenite/antimonite-responsive transcriptional repressor / arsenate reductase (thioredoxin)